MYAPLKPDIPIAILQDMPAAMITIGSKPGSKPDMCAPMITPSMVKTPSKAFITKYRLAITPRLLTWAYNFHRSIVFLILAGMDMSSDNKIVLLILNLLDAFYI
jgi:hypothetical protein